MAYKDPKGAVELELLFRSDEERLEMAKKNNYGGVVFDGFGRVLLREPKEHHGGYEMTFAKGAPQAGESPEQTALRKVLEKTGIEARIEETIPGLFEGHASSTTYFLMSRVRDTGIFNAKRTAEIWWIKASEADSLLSKTMTLIGRTRDRAVLRAALSLQSELKEQGRFQPEVPPPPAEFEGICTCNLPLPAYCWEVEVGGSCVGARCPVALSQHCEQNDSLSEEDPRLVKAVDELVERFIDDSDQREKIAAYARELYTREGTLGSSLPKAIIFAIYKASQFSYQGLALTRAWSSLMEGRELESWPGKGLMDGPTHQQMFENYSKLYP